MMLNENEWCEAMLGSDSNKTFKEYLYECYMSGDSVKEIAKVIKKSTSTVYKYIQEEYDLYRYPEIRAEIKKVLLQGDFETYIRNLSFKDISLIRRKFSLWGTTKQEKIHAILKYFKSYSILGVHPEHLSRAIVKSAFRKKAKETHPDLNKHLDKAGKEFQEVYQSYQYLMEIYA